MSNEGWAPRPRRDMNLNGIFSYDDGSASVKVEKANRWQQQRAQDGTPHTIPGPTVWSPPPAGPKLTLNDLDKGIAADMGPPNDTSQKKNGLDPEAVVKAYFSVVECLQKGDAAGAIAQAQSVSKQKVRGAQEEKSLSEDDDDKEDIKKYY